ncbi:Hsp20 family protein [Candidatus Poribacteria bacterium]|nr:Hsp20 family protein [Candidatus Poribacteria bacterium]
MSLIKWKDITDLTSIKDKMDEIFDRMFGENSISSMEERYSLVSSGIPSPETKTFQRGNDTVVQVNLPGFEKGDIKVTVSGNMLAIGSEVSREQEFRGDNAYRYRRSKGSFCKVMEIPAGVDTNRITSTYRDDILEIVMPRSGGKDVITVEVSEKNQSRLNQNNLPVNADTKPVLTTDLTPDIYDEED